MRRLTGLGQFIEILIISGSSDMVFLLAVAIFMYWVEPLALGCCAT